VQEAYQYDLEQPKKVSVVVCSRDRGCWCSLAWSCTTHVRLACYRRERQETAGEEGKALKEAHDKVEPEEDPHLYHNTGWTRELWINSLGSPRCSRLQKKKRMSRRLLGPPELSRREGTCCRRRGDSPCPKGARFDQP
jgi:hypothetical protein